ncbi:MAG: hypothetical protein NVS9B8_04970 [Candidatus Limnocylindrales bacterium]
MIDWKRGCARFRPALVDFVDRGEVRPATGAALAELDVCSPCTEVVEATMLTVTALRRMGDEAGSIEPASDAWPRLRARLEGLRRPWRRRSVLLSPVTGLVMSVAIVTVLILPFQLGGSFGRPLDSPAGGQSSISSLADRQIEAAYIASVRSAGPAGDDSAAERSSSIGGYPRNYPDNYRPTRKEVGQAAPNGRPPEAI